MRVTPLLALTILSACGGSAPRARPLAAEYAAGPANAPPGGILVFSSHCANMTVHCPMSWSPTVDAIVTSGLSFHGYQTIDPAHLRKDEATRTETTTSSSSSESVNSHQSGVETTAIVVVPITTFSTSSGSRITVRESEQKTVVLEGAVLEDLTIPDRRALMDLAGATSILTTQIIVGANWSSWSSNQRVEVMVKLSDAHDGSMRWSARCAASSGDYPSADAALEAAAHCVVDAMTAPPA